MGGSNYGERVTEYKRQLMDLLKNAYDNAYDSGAMRIEEPKAEFRILVQDRWREELNEIAPIRAD